MRIAEVALRFDAPGGVETCVRALARGLAAAGNEVTIHASDLYDEGRWERRARWAPEVDGVPVRRYPVEKKLIPGLTMPLMAGLVRGLDRDHPEVIHAHSHRYGHILEAAAVAERRRIPFVVSTHYHPADREEPTKKRMLLRLQDHGFGMTAYRNAAALVVETEAERALVAEFAPAERIHIIPPGIHLADWAHPEQDRPPEGLPERFLLYAGRVARNKGLPGLFDALGTLPKERRPPLVLMGRDWGLREELERRATRLGISGSLFWLDHVANESVYRGVFRKASVFVLPSEYEAFGLVLLEAMVAGVPIIATAVGGTPEVLEHGRSGQLVPYGDAGAMALAIDQAFSDPEAAKQRTAEGLRRVRGLDWAETVAGHHALFRSLRG